MRPSNRPGAVAIAAALGVLGPAAAQEPARFAFHDAVEWNGRQTLTFAALQLRDEPPRLPAENSDREIPGSARWGLLRVGETADDALLCAVAAREGGGLSVWIDGDGDGALRPDERATVSGGTIEQRIRVRRGEHPPLSRTVILRRSKLADGLQYAVRGTCAGEVSVGGERYAALLTDCDSNGLFHSPLADRILIDLDRDGRLDGVTEQFPLGRPIPIGAETYFAVADAGGERVWIRPRSTERGRLRVRLFDGTRDAVRVSASLVSDLGEAAMIEKLNAPLELPVGRYRVTSMSLELRESEAWKWLYLFDAPRQAGPMVEIRAGEESELTLLGELHLRMELERQSLQAGAVIGVSPSLATPAGLTLAMCERQNLHATYLREWTSADVFMIEPGGRRVALATSGFG